MRKGQIFSWDMALSILIFLSLVSVSLATVNQAIDKKTGFSEEGLMFRKGLQISDLLLRTSGNPEDWNYSNVRVTGLAEKSHLISAGKFAELREIPYITFKSMNRVPPYEVYIEFVSNGSVVSIGGLFNGRAAVLAGSSSGFIDALEASGNPWDLYWFGPGVPDMGYDSIFRGGSVELFDSVLDNSSIYDSLIVLDSAVSSSDLDRPGRLDEFVADGGTYFQEGSGDVFGAFDIVSSSAPDSGQVYEDSVLKDFIGSGDELDFESPTLSFSEFDTGYVLNGSECLVCGWDEGIYYFSDDSVLEQSRLELGLAESFVGSGKVFGVNSTYGKYFKSADSIVPVKRMVVLNRSNDVKRGVLRLMLWE